MFFQPDFSENRGDPAFSDHRTDTILRLKAYHLWASFPPWRCFRRPAPCAMLRRGFRAAICGLLALSFTSFSAVPVNVALLRLPSFSLASTKNTLRIFQAFRRELVFHIKSRPLAGDGMTAVPLRLKDNSFHSVRLNAASRRGLLLFRPRGSRRHCPHPRGALSACGAPSLARMNPDVFSGHCLLYYMRRRGFCQA